MAIKTLDVARLTEQTENIYEAVVILSKRARQVANRQKAELDDKLAYYEGFATEMENLRMQEEQARVSVDFETRPKAMEMAIDEMLDHEIYFRNPSDEQE